MMEEDLNEDLNNRVKRDSHFTSLMVGEKGIRIR